MTLEEFKEEIYQAMKDKPSHIRKGQFVFNYIELVYGDIARYVQFNDHIDCFYIDSKIDLFISRCYKYLKEWEEI